MSSLDRFAGPLAMLWPDLTAARLEPMLAAGGQALPVPTSADRSIWALTSGRADQASLQAAVDQARADLGQPWPALTASGWARFHRDGDRDAFEQLWFARQRRLSTATLAALATLEDADLTGALVGEVADGVIVLCEQSSWSLPAHDDAWTARGSRLPTVGDPYLDLAAGEVVAQLAWIVHVLGDALDQQWPGLSDRVRHEAEVRVFTPFLTRRDWHWLGLDGDVHNWNPWIHGNVLTAALALLPAGGRRAEVVLSCLEGLDRYLAVLPEDGAVDEGYGYWWNGACRALEALDVVRSATAGALDARSLTRLRETLRFPQRMHLGRDWCLSISDSPARDTRPRPWPVLHRLARQFDDAETLAFAASHHSDEPVVPGWENGLGRVLLTVTDTAWNSTDAAQFSLPQEVWLPSIEVLVSRQHSTSHAGLTLVAKGGHNGEHHNHNDVGEFVVALDGVPVIVDAGRPTYTRQTFSDQRYQIWTMQSQWHNVPSIGGVSQAAGEQYRARDGQTVLTTTSASMSLDLAAAYPGRASGRWQRTMTLDRHRGLITIDDVWALSDDAPHQPSELHVLLAGAVTQQDARRLQIVALDQAGLLQLEASTGEFTLEVKALDDPVLSQVWGAQLTRATLRLTSSRSGACQLTVGSVSTPQEDRDRPS